MGCGVHSGALQPCIAERVSWWETSTRGAVREKGHDLRAAGLDKVRWYETQSQQSRYTVAKVTGGMTRVCVWGEFGGLQGEKMRDARAPVSSLPDGDARLPG